MSARKGFAALTLVLGLSSCMAASGGPREHPPASSPTTITPSPAPATAPRSSAPSTPAAPRTISVPDSASDGRPSAQRARYLMGTLCTFEAQGGDTASVAAALVAALNEVARLERIMTPWDSLSEVCLLNKRAGSALACSADLYAVVDSSLVFARMTGGAFDPTVEPLTQVWDLRGKGRVPTQEEISDARSKVGWQLVDADAPSHTVYSSVQGYGWDLGGIGKGYALDKAAALLRSQAIPRARMNLGGELFVMSDARPWTIAIAHPERRLEPVLTFQLATGAVSTSSQSEHGFEQGGVRYGHILDPGTGRPVATRASVTVVAPSGTRADAFSTGLLVMGRERAQKFAALHSEIGVLWLEPEGAGVQAWKWNFPPSVAAPSGLRWMN